MKQKQHILFLCTHNSARSQMAEAILRHDLGEHYEAHSAGSEKTIVKPLALETLAALGIDASQQHSKTVDTYINHPMHYVITVCDAARDTCPFLPAKIKNIHHPFTDPSNATGSEQDIREAWKTSCNEIRQWIQKTFGNPT